MRAEQRAEHDEASFDCVSACFARSSIGKATEAGGSPRKAPAESFGAKGRAEKQQTGPPKASTRTTPLGTRERKKKRKINKMTVKLKIERQSNAAPELIQAPSQ